jgi:hypothetical protein
MATSTIGATRFAADSTLAALCTSRKSGDLMDAAVHSSADRVAGFLCAFSLALSGVALARAPGLLAPVAIVVALVAVCMTEAHRTLAAVAVTVSTLAFLVGMAIAITTDTALF